MPKTIHKQVTLRASPDVLFDTYLSSRKHTAATGAKAVMSRRVGGTFSAHAGHLRGRNLAIVPKRLIVQSWRGSNWKKHDLDSTLVLVFSRVPGGGRISMARLSCTFSSHLAAGHTPRARRSGRAPPYKTGDGKESLSMQISALAKRFLAPSGHAAT
jgi:uncharacterized protein YndB with AHSA1/START domain